MDCRWSTPRYYQLIQQPTHLGCWHYLFLILYVLRKFTILTLFPFILSARTDALQTGKIISCHWLVKINCKDYDWRKLVPSLYMCALLTRLYFWISINMLIFIDISFYYHWLLHWLYGDNYLQYNTLIMVKFSVLMGKHLNVVGVLWEDLSPNLKSKPWKRYC